MDLQHLKTEIAKDSVLLTMTNLVKRENVPFYLVGGYPRDLWLGTKRNDYDFVLPREASSFIAAVEAAFGFHFFKAGKGTETVTFRVIKNGISMDIAFLQGRNISEDLRRRDFTVNALAFSLGDEEWHWAEGTLEDLRDRRIRTVSDVSLDRDPLRMLRAIRYVCTLHEFSIDDVLTNEISSKKELILTIPGERVRMELDRILLSQRPSVGIDLLFETGLLFCLLPEMKETKGAGRREHTGDLPHSLLAAEKLAQAIEWVKKKGMGFSLLPDDILSLYYAALFHDIGRQSPDLRRDGNPSDAIMERLRFSNVLKGRVLYLVRNYRRILDLSPGTKETVLKNLVHEIGEAVPLLVICSLADQEASPGSLSPQSEQAVETHCLHLLDLFRQEEVVHPPELISGEDVLALGYQAGPEIGRILSIIRIKQVQGEIKTREEALEVLREKFRLE